MAEIDVLGVYRLEVTAELFQAQLPMYGDEGQCRDHFSSVVLIEVIVSHLDRRFDVGDFSQSFEMFGSAQLAYDEAWRSLDGERVLQRDILCLRNQGAGPIRLAL